MAGDAVKAYTQHFDDSAPDHVRRSLVLVVDDIETLRADQDTINDYLSFLGEQDGVISGDYTVVTASAATMTGAGSIAYRIGGEAYFDDSLQAAVDPADPGTTKVTSGNWGAWRVVIDRLGVITTESPDTAGQSTEEKAYLHLAAVSQAANTAVIGYFTVHATADAGGFIPGTDDMDASQSVGVRLLRRPPNESAALWAAQGAALVLGDGLATYSFGTVSPKVRGLRLATITADATQALTDADTIAAGESGGWLLVTNLAGTDIISLSSDGVPGVTALADGGSAEQANTALDLVAARLPAIFTVIGRITVASVVGEVGTFTAKTTLWDAAGITSTPTDQTLGTHDRTVGVATFLAKKSNPPAIPSSITAGAYKVTAI